MAAFALLLFPGHADEGSLDVVIYNLGASSWSFLHFLFIRRVTCRQNARLSCLFITVDGQTTALQDLAPNYKINPKMY